QAKGVAARRGNAGTREKAGEIDQVEPVVEILHVGLHTHDHMFVLDQVCARGNPESKRRPDPAAIEVHPIDDLSSKLLNRVVDGAIERSGQAAPVGASEGKPGSGHDLVSKAAAYRVALVLRNRKAPRIGQSVRRLIT